MTALVPSNGGADGAVGDHYGCEAFILRGDHIDRGGNLSRYHLSLAVAGALSSTASAGAGPISSTIYASIEHGVVL